MSSDAKPRVVPVVTEEALALDLREDAKVKLDLKTLVGAIGLVIIACGLYWHQDGRIERLEGGLQRVENVNCAVAGKMGLTLPDCGSHP